MKSTSKVELTIISGAVILSLVVFGIFWWMNRDTAAPSTALYVAPVSEPEPEAAVVASEPEPSPVTALGLAKLKDTTTVNALVLGDSVAESVGASNKDLSSWYTLVAKDLQRNYPGTLEWTFNTSDKATIDDALKTLPEITPETDLVMLCVGRNDWSTLTTDDFKLKYEQFLAEVTAKSPDAEVFLVVEPPVKDVAMNNQTFPYRRVILDISKEHQLPVIDAWTVFIEDPTPLNGLLFDGVNPNDTGYSILAAEVVRKFEERLALLP
ncbi:MAG TPA: SGNH/GDSL hydrolase family protein [Desulfosporosinus sp.]|nr:SGNH/GDSL hydrolase family protein [Desulfosporosinus sp.]